MALVVSSGRRQIFIERILYYIVVRRNPTIEYNTLMMMPVKVAAIIIRCSGGTESIVFRADRMRSRWRLMCTRGLATTTSSCGSSSTAVKNHYHEQEQEQEQQQVQDYGDSCDGYPSGSASARISSSEYSTGNNMFQRSQEHHRRRRRLVSLMQQHPPLSLMVYAHAHTTCTCSTTNFAVIMRFFSNANTDTWTR